MKKAIHTNNAPAALGPYSQAIDIGDFVYLSGQVPINPANGNVESDNITEQTKQVLTNITEVLKEANLTIENVVKTTVFLKDMNDFGAMNEVYATYFKQPYPARSAVQVGKLPKDVRVEIEVIAYRNI